MMDRIEFTSSLNPKERANVLIYLPLHVWIFPLILGIAAGKGRIDPNYASILLYFAGLMYLIITATGFLRRELDAFLDKAGRCLLFAAGAVLLLLLIEFTGDQLGLFPETAGTELAEEQRTKFVLYSVVMTPIVDGVLLGAGMFGTLRQGSRKLAYLVGVLFFAFYYVWGYAMLDSSFWAYLIVYLPFGAALCFCYEQTNTIWTPILIHAAINAVSLWMGV